MVGAGVVNVRLRQEVNVVQDQASVNTEPSAHRVSWSFVNVVKGRVREKESVCVWVSV